MSRQDGRQFDELRPITINTEFTKTPAASVLITSGDTIVWCAASVEDSIPHWLKKEGGGKGWITAEYMMLPGSTNPRSNREGRRGQVGGRTQEIQRLIGRSLRAVTDLEKLGERTITLDCEVLQADGGTRTAAINGSFIALALVCKRLVRDQKIAQFPLKHSLGAISVGVVNGEVLLDLPYVEDVAADVDMNVVTTGSGRFIEVQGTGEEATFTDEEFQALLKVAHKGIADITRLQREALGNDPLFAKLFA